MPTSSMSTVIHHLRRTLCLQDEDGLTDAQLLERFIERREEAAFAALVRRHGSMVMGVCLRVVRNHQDAEDAFQATFLILVRKAASIASRGLLANWLYGVAYNTALKAKASNVKRQAKEKQVTTMPNPMVAQQEAGNDDLQALLDQELSQLPEKYRVPIILCDLEGKTRKEAAQELRCPEGTLSTRLSRARIMLAKRLARHGLAVSGGSLAAVLTQNVTSACVPTSVVSSTIKAATLFAAGNGAMISVNVIALTEGVLKAMLMTKLKTAMAVLLVLGMVTLTCGVLARGQTDGKGDIAEKPAAKVAETPQDDQEKLQGTWRELVFEQDGLRMEEEKLKNVRVVIAGNTIQFGGPGVDLISGSVKADLFRFKLGPSTTPKEIQFWNGNEVYRGIYHLAGDDLKLCYVTGRESKLPTDFTVPPGSERRLIILKRGGKGEKGEGALKPAAKTEEKPPQNAKQKDLDALQGKWRVERTEANGKKIDDEAGNIVIIKGNTLGDEKRVAPFEIDPTTKPKSINLKDRPDAVVTEGIYKIEPDTLVLCLSNDIRQERKRPSEFSTKPGSLTYLIVLKRISEEKKEKVDEEKKAELLDQQKKFLAALQVARKKGDTDALKGILADDFILITPESGRTTDPKGLLLTRQTDVLLEPKVTMPNKVTALVTYEGLIRAFQPYRYVETAVWAQQDDRWRIGSFQITKIEEKK